MIPPPDDDRSWAVTDKDHNVLSEPASHQAPDQAPVGFIRPAVPHRSSFPPTGADQAALVGQHHELGPVTGVELDHRPADMGPGGGR